MSSNDSLNYAKTWELSLYELNRLPHDVITDDTEIAVSPRSLHNELMCPICLDILKNTMTTKECLHRFCQDCIITALRAGNKECPTCRKKLISKRSLRRDPNFDALISKIYPNRDEYDALHEKVLEKLNKRHLNHHHYSHNQTRNRHNTQNTNSNGDTSIEMGNNNNNSNNNQRKSNRVLNGNSGEDSQQNIDNDNLQNTSMPTTSTNALQTASSISMPSSNNKNINTHESTSRKRTISDESDLDSQSHTSTEQSHIQSENEELELILKPHPKESTHSSKRFLKTTSNATVNHLSKYLTMRLCIDTNKIDAINNTTNPSTSKSQSTSNPDLTDFQIYINQTAQEKTSPYHLLPGILTLEQINEKYWKQNKPIELYYIFKNPTS